MDYVQIGCLIGTIEGYLYSETLGEGHGFLDAVVYVDLVALAVCEFLLDHWRNTYAYRARRRLQRY